MAFVKTKINFQIAIQPSDEVEMSACETSSQGKDDRVLVIDEEEPESKSLIRANLLENVDFDDLYYLSPSHLWL